eukprot:8718201-Prorocentrum_lima.AAC.1
MLLHNSLPSLQSNHLTWVDMVEFVSYSGLTIVYRLSIYELPPVSDCNLPILMPKDPLNGPEAGIKWTGSEDVCLVFDWNCP